MSIKSRDSIYTKTLRRVFCDKFFISRPSSFPIYVFMIQKNILLCISMDQIYIANKTIGWPLYPVHKALCIVSIWTIKTKHFIVDKMALRILLIFLVFFCGSGICSYTVKYNNVSTSDEVISMLEQKYLLSLSRSLRYPKVLDLVVNPNESRNCEVNNIPQCYRPLMLQVSNALNRYAEEPWEYLYVISFHDMTCYLCESSWHDLLPM